MQMNLFYIAEFEPAIRIESRMFPGERGYMGTRAILIPFTKSGKYSTVQASTLTYSLYRYACTMLVARHRSCQSSDATKYSVSVTLPTDFDY